MSPESWRDLIRRFEACELAESEWTHAAHLAAGAWFVTHFSAEEAAYRIRNGIKRLNESLGGKNTETSGYHETLTIFWLRQIAKRLREGASLEEITALPSGLWRDYYSYDVVKSTQARREWVEPDLKPITP